MTKTLTAKDVLELGKYKNKISKMTSIEFKKLTKEIMDQYGLEAKDALSLLRNENGLKILSKYERKEKEE